MKPIDPLTRVPAKKRKSIRQAFMVEFAKLWLPIIGAGIFITWGITAFYSGFKVTGIWALFAGTVCLLLLGTLQVQDYIRGENPVADDGTKKRTRAYLGIYRVTIQPLDVSRITAVEIVWKNTGATPAYETTAWGTFQMLPYPNTAELPRLPSGPPGAKTTVAANGAMGQTNYSKRPPTIEEISAVNAGELAIFAYGEIRYKDVFGDAHTTKFRYACGGSYGSCEGNMWACESGNDAD